MRRCATLSLLRASPGWPLRCAVPAPRKPRVTLLGHPGDACVPPLATRATHASQASGSVVVLARECPHELVRIECAEAAGEIVAGRGGVSRNRVRVAVAVHERSEAIVPLRDVDKRVF